MQKKIIAPGYMHEFRCLGGDCEDTCCQKWDINLDKKHYDLLAENVIFNSDDKDLFDKYTCLHDEANSSDNNYAYIKLNESGYCPFLNTAGLCHLHDHYGVEPLSDVCAFFPRVLSEYNNTTELTGALSCPEVVRRCLFGDSDLNTMNKISPAVLPREEYPVSRKIYAPEDGYQKHFTEVREQMILLMADNDYAFETRLYFLANFSSRLASHYHHGCEITKSVAEEIKRFQNKDIKNQLDDYFFKFSNTEPVAVIVIQAILQLRIQHEGDDKLSQLASSILENYKVDYERSEDFDVYGENIPPEQLSKSFLQHWDKLNSRYGAVLEEYLARYVINCLQREWFISMPDPFVYIHMLTIRVAVLRFLITSHPEIIEMVNSDISFEDSINHFNKKIVEIVYLYARSIDHNHTFLHVVFQAIREQQMMSFDYSMAFIKL